MDDELQARAAAYAVGALDPAEAKAFEAQLAQRADLQVMVRELREVSAQLAYGAPAAPPSPALRDRVIAAARTSASPAEQGVIPIRHPRFAIRPPLAWAAALAGIVVAGAQTVRIARRDAVVDNLAARVDSLSARRDVLEERLNGILDGRTVMNVLLPTGQGGPRFGAQVFWRADQQTWVVHVFDMPRLPAGSVYQLWYVTPDRKISATVLALDEEGHGVQVLKVPAEARGANIAAISVEPGPDGSTQPTGPIVVAGAVRSE